MGIQLCGGRCKLAVSLVEIQKVLRAVPHGDMSTCKCYMRKLLFGLIIGIIALLSASNGEGGCLKMWIVLVLSLRCGYFNFHNAISGGLFHF